MTFDFKAARAKRPLPLWVDALLRDTSLLEPDEFGAYMRILMAMWTSRAVALPDEPRKLARASGISLRLWNMRVGPALRGFFTPCNEGLTQKRLREEAAYTERQVTRQANRKVGVNNDNPLKSNDQHPSADTSTDHPRVYPTQLPNRREDGGGNGRARDHNPQPRSEIATAREQILEIMGLDGTGILGPSGKMVGRVADMQEYRRWQTDLNLNHETIIDIIREVITDKRQTADPSLPSTFSYFTKAMQRTAAAMATKPPLRPIEEGQRNANGYHPASHSRDPKSKAVGGMVESFQRLALQQAGSENDQ